MRPSESPSTTMSTQLKEFQEHLLKSKKIVALVGAGLSVSSGLPTFRGSQGLWKNFNMIDLATPDAFYIDPGLVWQFYSWRRYTALKAKPNKGHYALAKLSQMGKSPQSDLTYITITQNVDGLSSRSGHCKENLYEIHGSLFDLKCTSFMCNFVDHNNFKQPLTKALADTEEEFDPSHNRKRSLDEQEVSISPQFNPVKTLSEKELPQCPVCKDGSLLRPGVVWFGESLPLSLITKVDNFIESEGSPVDLILVIGTSGTVYPANSYVDRVKLKGGKVAIFNTDIENDIVVGKVKDTWGFKGDAAELLPLALKPLIGEI
ncbi:transcriptional regulatory protein [Spathaspora passalidarum NRRL Y-27907]|uniref:NAD-dependent protein deacylase n=1 Tax=Spathaspora passalidarum (strain NRRL Y-27907 / 11-Y1) TaxID=619300 RepID=G3AF83_SPAPN|nr:transcriptional regulatory protein [Spathaspora passalidarum NRRL Y-27907]EGW34872.1 transcriptional regulatory protein [Spathaspora passalidarum NRRL Y-27907]